MKNFIKLILILFIITSTFLLLYTKTSLENILFHNNDDRIGLERKIKERIIYKEKIVYRKIPPNNATKEKPIDSKAKIIIKKMKKEPKVPSFILHNTMQKYDWVHYRKTMQDSFIYCKGFTTIKCATIETDIGQVMKKAYFCYAQNLFEWVTQGAALKYIAVCTRQNLPHSRYFEDLRYKMVGPPIEYMENNNLGLEINGSKTRLSINGKKYVAAHIPKDLMTYVAFGGCDFSNPGHCMGDWFNLFIVRKLLNKTVANTRVLLYSGFGKNVYHSAKHKNLRKEEIPGEKKRIKSNDKVKNKQRTVQSTEHEDIHFFLNEWKGLARQVHDSKDDLIDWSMLPLRLLKTTAFSPLGGWSP